MIFDYSNVTSTTWGTDVFPGSQTQANGDSRKMPNRMYLGDIQGKKEEREREKDIVI